ncbi:MAG: non-homologous end-joining DNA ligase [Stackebrandtia sp.]
MSPAEVEVRASRRDKMFFPDAGVTKGQVFDYYRDVAEAMLPHLRRRPATLRRFPDGIDAEGFFQKEVSGHFPDWLDVADVPLRQGGVQHYAVVSDVASLLYLADQATIEFHIWPSAIDSLDDPDLIVVDIDPPQEIALAELRSVARRTRDLLSDLGLVPFVQATGGKGFHVVAPLDASASFDEVRALAADAADALVDSDPRRLTTAQRKRDRGDRIFLDVNRNGYAQTFVTPYSLRARPGATAAVPLDWDELGKAEPNGWNITRALRRLARKADPWASIYDHAASAHAARQRLASLVDRG